MEQPAAKYEGWTLIELFGHGREAGYVTTQYFGDKAMFQVDVPEIPARQETLEAPCWGADKLLPVGTVIEKEAIAGRTRFLSPGAIYAFNPATEEAVREAIARSERREIRVIALPYTKQIAAPEPSDDEDFEMEEDDD